MMNYRREIDGLRAIAVIPVLLFHAHIPGFSGGFVGVDVFFVISGFLITSILIAEMENGNYQLSNFYERRLRRILPALAFVLLTTYPFAYAWLLPSEFTIFSESIIAVVFFVSNILFFLESDYFATASELKPLLHTWSLAIEEQYYVFFPIFLALFWRFKLTVVLGAMLIIFVTSLSLSHWASTQYESANFYLLPTRAWELLLGAFGAFIIYYKGYCQSKTISELASLTGLILVLYAIFLFDKNTPFPSLYALVPATGTLLIIIFATGDTIVKKVLGLRVLVGIGLISYSLYLWHQPLFALAKQRVFFQEPNLFLMLALIAFAIVLSIFSWRFVEKPFRNKKRFLKRHIFQLSALTSFLLVVVGTLGFYRAESFTPGFLASYQIKNFTFDNPNLREKSWSILREKSNDDFYQVDQNPFDKTLWYDLTDLRKKVLIIGNSHSKDIFNIFYFSKTAQNNFQIARFGEQIEKLNTTHFELPNFKHADIIVIASQYRNDKLNLDWLIDKSKALGKKVAIIKNIEEVRTYSLRKLTIADVTLKEAVSKGTIESSTIKNLSDKAYYEYFNANPTRQHKIHSDKKIEALAIKYPNLMIMDRKSYMCNKVKCFSMNDDLQKHYYDYGHHTITGAQFFAEIVDSVAWLEPLIQE